RLNYQRSLRDGTMLKGVDISQQQLIADKMLYVSNYENSFDPMKGPLPNVKKAKTAPAGTGDSLYHDSYVSPRSVNTKLLDSWNDGAPIGKTKLLYAPTIRGLGVRDLLHVEPADAAELYRRTSYRTDYLICPPIEIGPIPPMTSLSSVRTVEPKAFKYRRWGGWAGAV
ncbi:hypothetical protein BDK51DRAFT_29885, partial [Blyttiomyces helicus]